MERRDYRDMIGGGLLIATGAFVALYAVLHYALGTLNNMGPGMFPAMLGTLLVIFGAGILVPAWRRSGAAPFANIDVRSLVLVLAAILLFALLIQRVGLIPSVAVASAVATRADTRLGPVAMVAYAAILSVAVYLIFSVGLGTTVDAFMWRI